MYEIKKCGYTIQYEIEDWQPKEPTVPEEYFIYKIFINGNEIDYDFEDDICNEVNEDFIRNYKDDFLRACTRDRYFNPYNFSSSKNPNLYYSR
jgi:hypothetical protein